MHIKQIVLMMVFIIMLIGTVSVTAADKKIIQMDLNTAVEKAFKNDLTLQTIENRILLAKRNYRSAVHKADNVNLNTISDDDLLKNGLAYAYEPIKKEQDVLDLKIQQIQRIKEVETEVRILYSSIIRQIDSINLFMTELETLTVEVKNQETLLKNGKITILALESYNTAFRSTELDILKAERTLDNFYMQLNLMLGLELDSRPELNPKDIINDVVIEYDMDSLLDFVKTSCELVYNTETRLKLATLERDTTKRYSRYYLPDNYEILKETVIDLEESLEEARETAQMDLMTAYNNLLNKKDDLEIANLKLEIAVDNVENVTLRHDLGLSTYLDVKKAQDSVTDAENTIFNTLIDLYKQKSSFDLTILFSSEIE